MQTIYNCNKFLGEVVHLLTDRNAGVPIFLSMPVCVPSVSRDPQNMRKGHPLSYSVQTRCLYLAPHFTLHAGSLE